MASVTVVGEVVIDRVMNGESCNDVPGGSSANVALALTRCGYHVDFRARFGADTYGQLLRSHAIDAGVDVTNSVSATEPATVVDISLDEQGSPTYTFHLSGTADWQWTTDELARPLPTDTSAIVLGSLASIATPGFDAQYAWAQAHSQSGIPIFYDPNVRPTAIKALDFVDLARARIMKWVKLADVVKASDEDLLWCNPAESAQETAEYFSTLGPQLVILTAGSQGAFAFRNGALIAQVQAPHVSVVDTVGAGDTLMAWLVSGYCELPAAQQADSAKIQEVLAQAVKAAAYTCTRTGCDPIYRDQLPYFLT